MAVNRYTGAGTSTGPDPVLHANMLRAMRLGEHAYAKATTLDVAWMQGEADALNLGIAQLYDANFQKLCVRSGRTTCIRTLRSYQG